MLADKVLITGCAGMLGEAIYPYFAPRFDHVLATDIRADAIGCSVLDVSDADAVKRKIAEFQPEIILHLAAKTNLEFCELNQAEATATNVHGTRTLAQLAEEAEATLVYISTAGVFDGTKEGFYTEADTPNPIMVYGDTKYRGEEMVREYCRRHYIVRAGWMVGGGPLRDHKFVSRILSQILSGKQTVHAVDDLLGTPTYTYDFAVNLFQLLATGSYGTYHMVCEGAGSRFDVARELVRISGLEGVQVIPVGSDFFKEEYFAPRPRSEMMLNENLNKLGMNLMRPWRDALREYVTIHYGHELAACSQPTYPTSS